MSMCLCLSIKKIHETNSNKLCGHLVFFFSMNVNVCVCMDNNKEDYNYLNVSSYQLANDIIIFLEKESLRQAVYIK